MYAYTHILVIYLGVTRPHLVENVSSLWYSRRSTIDLKLFHIWFKEKTFRQFAYFFHFGVYMCMSRHLAQALALALPLIQLGLTSCFSKFPAAHSAFIPLCPIVYHWTSHVPHMSPPVGLPFHLCTCIGDIAPASLWRTVNLTVDLSVNLTVTRREPRQAHSRSLSQANRQAFRMRH